MAAPGSKLPSSRALVREYGASPVTVQRAVTALARDGLVETRPGVGTFVRGVRPTRSADQSWQTAALGRVRVRPPALPSLEPLDAEGISLHSGYPAADLLPERLVRSAFTRASRGTEIVGPVAPAGSAPLRDWFAAELAAQVAPGVAPVTRADVLITPGSQSALTAIFRSLTPTGGTVVTESPTYWGALSAAAQVDVRVHPVSTGAGGPDPAEVDRALRESGSRVFYAQPTFSNPMGTTWTPGVREAVLEVVRERGAFLVEDDWAHDFAIDPAPAPIAAIDDAGHVIHVRSLTKSVASSVRVAGIVARGPVRDRILGDIAAESMYVSPVLQAVALDVVTRPAWATHLRRVRTDLADRRDLLLDAVRTHLPEAVVDSVPAGGLHLWVRLPDGTDLDALRGACRLDGVQISAGDAAFPAEPTGRFLRLTYSAAAPTRFPEAVRTIARHLRAQTG